MMKNLALAAVASMVMAMASPVEAAMPNTGIGVHPTGYVTPVKMKKMKIYKKKVCHNIYGWKWVWWKGHPAFVKVKIGRECHWKPIRLLH